MQDDRSLEQVLTQRDERGGGIFWLTLDNEYPALVVGASGDMADVHYFPRENHPGFRCLGGDASPETGFTTLVYPGCDPSGGENVPNEFIVSFQIARAIAREFSRSGQMSDAVRWFEL